MNTDLKPEMIGVIVEAFRKHRGAGTFLSLRLSGMGGPPVAEFTHGRIQFDDAADLCRFVNDPASFKPTETVRVPHPFLRMVGRGRDTEE